MTVAIVPAYNESKRIASVVATLFEVVDTVVVVDDASVDGTATLAATAGATVLRHALNRGQGAAIETGQSYARHLGATYTVHFDGDGQFDAAEIPSAISVLKQSGADILFGSRFLSETGNMPWFKRQILHPLSRFVDRSFGAVKLTDVHNGFRILTARALEIIIIRQDGMAHASEIPILVRKHGLAYTEFPVTVSYHEYGQSSLGAFRIVRDLLIKKL
jgi:glycosyltransferase involved in cell wall biosynthesis